MIDIVRKELLENLTTYRFYVLTGLPFSMMLISIIVSYGDYHLRVENYNILRPGPRFQYRPAGVLERVEPDLSQWGVLIAFNLIFFAGAFVSFQRYDVR